MSARTVRRAAVLAIGAAAFVAAGCGGSSSDESAAGVTLQREDLVAVAHALQGAEAEAATELQATKQAWGYVMRGLPRRSAGVAAAAIAQAHERSARLRMPPLFGEVKARELTGAAAALAAEFRTFAVLSAAGWHQIAYALSLQRNGPRGAARFARANVALYIESVYDGHFTAGQIGRRLPVAYKKLGGEAKFGTTLTQSEVDSISGSYAEAAYTLKPRATVHLGS